MSVFLPFDCLLLPVSRESGTPVPLWRHCSQDIAHSNQIVAGQRHQHLKANPVLVAELGFSYRPDVFSPTENFFDALAYLLTYFIARMRRGPSINRGTPVGIILCNMRGDLEFTCFSHEAPSVVEFVRTDSI